jgi:hypothetical protein
MLSISLRKNTLSFVILEKVQYVHNKQSTRSLLQSYKILFVSTQASSLYREGRIIKLENAYSSNKSNFD